MSLLFSEPSLLFSSDSLFLSQPESFSDSFFFSSLDLSKFLLSLLGFKLGLFIFFSLSDLLRPGSLADLALLKCIRVDEGTGVTDPLSFFKSILKFVEVFFENIFLNLVALLLIHLLVDLVTVGFVGLGGLTVQLDGLASVALQPGVRVNQDLVVSIVASPNVGTDEAACLFQPWILLDVRRINEFVKSDSLIGIVRKAGIQEIKAFE